MVVLADADALLGLDQVPDSQCLVELLLLLALEETLRLLVGLGGNSLKVGLLELYQSLCIILDPLHGKLRKSDS
jgi:hypothetical protein